MAGSLRDAMKKALGNAAGKPGSGEDKRGSGGKEGSSKSSGRGGSQEPTHTGPKFHNPYHFVPVEKPKKAKDWLIRKDFEHLAEAGPNEARARLSHAQYRSKVDKQPLYTGRIICRLENETPFFIGAQRVSEATDDCSAEVASFELEKGRPALPASSLRGLVSSIAEAATGSALRVLTKRVLSFRKKMGESLWVRLF
jgi:hypothetical protein